MPSPNAPYRGFDTVERMDTTAQSRTTAATPATQPRVTSVDATAPLARMTAERDLYRAFYDAFVESDRLANIVGPTPTEWHAADAAFEQAEDALVAYLDPEDGGTA